VLFRSVVARGDLDLMVLYRDAFLEDLRANPAATARLLDVVAHRLVKSTAIPAAVGR
jgi:CRP-like cAMP-binding protein